MKIIFLDIYGVVNVIPEKFVNDGYGLTKECTQQAIEILNKSK